MRFENLRPTRVRFEKVEVHATEVQLKLTFTHGGFETKGGTKMRGFKMLGFKMRASK